MIPLVTLVTAGDRRRCEKERDRIQLRAGDDPDPGGVSIFCFQIHNRVHPVPPVRFIPSSGYTKAEPTGQRDNTKNTLTTLQSVNTVDADFTVLTRQPA